MKKIIDEILFDLSSISDDLMLYRDYCAEHEYESVSSRSRFYDEQLVKIDRLRESIGVISADSLGVESVLRYYEDIDPSLRKRITDKTCWLEFCGNLGIGSIPDVAKDDRSRAASRRPRCEKSVSP